MRFSINIFCLELILTNWNCGKQNCRWREATFIYKIIINTKVWITQRFHIQISTDRYALLGIVSKKLQISIAWHKHSTFLHSHKKMDKYYLLWPGKGNRITKLSCSSNFIHSAFTWSLALVKREVVGWNSGLQLGYLFSVNNRRKLDGQ